MAKPPPEPIEDFTVTIRQVPKFALGDLHAALAKLDLSDVESNLVTHVPKFATRPEIKSTDFIMTWSEDNPTFKAIDVVNAFEAAGRGRTTAYPAISVLVEKRLLKKVGPGEYARADQKALPAPPKKEKKREPYKTYDKPGTEVILSYMRRNHGRGNNTKLNEIFVAEGRAKGSVSASIDKLLKDKMIKRVGDSHSGQYVLLNKAQTERKKALVAEKKEAPKTDGVTTIEGLEAANG